MLSVKAGGFDSQISFQSLAQIVQDSWMDERVNYTAYQALLKLAFLLRSRFMQLNSSDFYVPEGGSVSEVVFVGVIKILRNREMLISFMNFRQKALKVITVMRFHSQQRIYLEQV